MGWGWRGGTDGAGLYPGRGPFNDLPPWQRPGWLYGKGACWRRYQSELKPEDEATLLTEQKTVIEEQITNMHETLEKIQRRLDELRK